MFRWSVVKQTYEALVNSDERPTLFVDVGQTTEHTPSFSLFLTAGIPIIAFEPNPMCLSDSQKVCQLNAKR
jgi:hypothetical protein